jgi:3-dehydroquinate synthase
MPRVYVKLATSTDRSYVIDIRPGVLTELPGLISSLAGNARVFLITDSTVARLYGRAIHRALEGSDLRTVLLEVPPGEQSKSPRMAAALQTRLLTEGVTRDGLVVALGGGVVGDLAGFVAATVLRGVRFLQVPTTLLAQVDSSVGGKVGIDHPAGKNLIGAFHQPSGVVIDPLVLRSLSAAEFKNGMAEVVKIAAALDGDFFSFLSRNARNIRVTDSRLMTDIVARATGLKAAVVEKDEKETGLRKSLNLGHTIGHALEAATKFTLRHGEAVSIGMIAEGNIAVELGMLPPGDLRLLERTLVSLGLPTAFPGAFNAKAFAAALSLDKKNDAAGVKFSLLTGIGRCALGVPVSYELIRKFGGEASISVKGRTR